MTINWPLVCLLFCLSFPGTYLAMSRLIRFLLPNNTEELKKRMSRFAIFQTMFMVLVMSIAGVVLSVGTGLSDPVFEGLLLGNAGWNTFQDLLLPVFLYALGGVVIFCALFYGVIASILDDHSFHVMLRLRRALGTDGCVLYGGVVEEVIARWGLINLLAFFAVMFAGKSNSIIIWLAIFFSGLLFGVGQIPAYLAAGCISSRRLIYSILLLCLCQSMLFGYVFWQYGLLASMAAHMLFHLGWSYYDSRQL